MKDLKIQNREEQVSSIVGSMRLEGEIIPADALAILTGYETGLIDPDSAIAQLVQLGSAQNNSTILITSGMLDAEVTSAREDGIEI